MTPWPKGELHRIARADDLHVAPLCEDRVTYTSPTWVLSVRVDEALYARSFNGQRSSWYRAAVRQQAGRISTADRLKEVAFEPVDGPSHEALNDRIDDAYRTKYRGSPYLNAMIGKRARTATIKIMPR